MSSDEQATAYLREAALTLQSARTIFDAEAPGDPLWAQVVKNAYDAIEQAVSAAIAAEEEPIPRRHPAKINAFLDLYDLEERLLTWLRRRSDAQYVDIRGDEVTIPHEQFDESDAERILEDSGAVLRFAKQACGGR